MTQQLFRLLTIILCLATSKFVIAGTDYRPIKVNLDSDHISIGDYQFSETNDSTFNLRYLKCTNANSILLDTTNYSPYESTYFAWDSKLSKDTIIIWSIENEFYSVLHLFYVNKNKILKFGELSPLLICKKCDSQSYPLSSIKMVDEKTSIRFEFLRPVIFKDEKTDNITTDKVFFVYNKLKSELKMHWR